MSTQAIDPKMLDGELPPPPERGEKTPTPKDAAEQPDPWGELGEEDRDWLGKKGYRDPAAILRAHRELETRFGKASEEAGQMRELLAQLVEERESQSAQQPQPQQQNGGLDWRALAEQCIDPQTGEVDLGTYGSVIFQLAAQTALQAAEQRWTQHFQQFESERISPLIERVELEDTAEALAQAQAVYGDRFKDVSDEVDAITDDDPDAVDRIGVEALYERAWGRIQMREEQSRRREADGFTLSRSGRRTERPTSAADRELGILDMAQRALRSRDGL